MTGGLVGGELTVGITNEVVKEEKKAAGDSDNGDGKTVDATKIAATTATSAGRQDKQVELQEGKREQQRGEQEDATSETVSAAGELAKEGTPLPQYVLNKGILHDDSRRQTLLQILTNNDSPNSRDNGAGNMNLLDSTYIGRRNLSEEQQLWGERVGDASTRENDARGKDARARSGNLHGTSGDAPSLSEFKVRLFQPFAREGGRGGAGAGSAHN